MPRNEQTHCTSRHYIVRRFWTYASTSEQTPSPLVVQGASYTMHRCEDRSAASAQSALGDTAGLRQMGKLPERSSCSGFVQAALRVAEPCPAEAVVVGRRKRDFSVGKRSLWLKTSTANETHFRPAKEPLPWKQSFRYDSGITIPLSLSFSPSLSISFSPQLALSLRSAHCAISGQANERKNEHACRAAQPSLERCTAHFESRWRCSWRPARS